MIDEQPESQNSGALESSKPSNTSVLPNPRKRSDGNGLSPFPAAPMTKFNWIWARNFVIQLQTRYFIDVVNDEGMPAASQVNLWMKKYPKFNQWVERSRMMFADYLAEKSSSMFDEPAPMETIKTKTGEYQRISMSGVQRERYKSQSMQWLASRFNPEKYGDKLQVANSFDLTAVLNLVHTPSAKKLKKLVDKAEQPAIDVQNVPPVEK
jgi:hypothetical protein